MKMAQVRRVTTLRTISKSKHKSTTEVIVRSSGSLIFHQVQTTATNRLEWIEISMAQQIPPRISLVQLSNPTALIFQEQEVLWISEFKYIWTSQKKKLPSTIFKLLEFISTEEAITLSASPTTVDEGSTLAVTLSVPTNVSTDAIFNLTGSGGGGGDGSGGGGGNGSGGGNGGGGGSELSIPATVTILAGTNSINFDVSGLTDGEFDGDQDVTITAALAGYISDSIDITVVDAQSATPSGDLIISQYYEGSSDNKYIEVTNIGDTPIDLTGYTIVRWGNERAEEYKTADSLPADNADSLDLSSLGTIQPDQTMVFANSGADSPLARQQCRLERWLPWAIRLYW